MAADRLALLRVHSTLIGIDYVHVDPATQQDLYVYFVGKTSGGSLQGVPGAATAAAFTGAGEVTITTTSAASSETPEVEVTSAAWEIGTGARNTLHIQTATRGDFTRYTLALSGALIDPYYSEVEFSFQAGCPSDLDCRTAEPACPDEEAVDVPIDYSARDFWSFRRALLDFASQRYPQWLDRKEADAGVMFVEAISALADEMAYHQDRVAREAHLETATQRRSLRQHANLLDYNIHDGLAGSTWLVVTVAGVEDTTVVGGTDVWAQTDAGAQINFEVGKGLSDVIDAVDYGISPELNALTPYIWDEDATCLHAGGTSVHVEAVLTTELLVAGRRVVLRTYPTDASVPARAWVVVLTDVAVTSDPLLEVDLVKLTWSSDDAPPFDLDLETLVVQANVVPATAGRTVDAGTFTIREAEDEWDGAVPHAIERAGPDRTTGFLFSLPDSDTEALCWLHHETDEGVFTGFGDDPRQAEPEVYLAAVDSEGLEWEWTWRRTLVGSPASLPTDQDFTLDDGTYQEVVRYWRGKPDPVRHYDYKTGTGFTIRFGDDSIGASPARGTVFTLSYRLGSGTVGNVPADSLTNTAATGMTFTNPFPVTNGLEPETAADIRRLAPQAWRAQTLRAVREEDYAEALERLDWVQRAGAKLRWTGSWHTLFATPDPRDRFTLSEDQRADASAQLERFRQAGREAHVLEPVYAWLDFDITVCVEPSSYRGQVESAVLVALCGTGSGGFFDPDNFTFGDPLYRSSLEAAIHAVTGVRAVETILVRRRGWFDWTELTDDTIVVGQSEVIGVANDRRYPERGIVKLRMEGGA